MTSKEVGSMKKRFAVFYTNPGGYTGACFDELVAGLGWSGIGVQYRHSNDAPFTDDYFGCLVEKRFRDEFKNEQVLAKWVKDYGVDVIYISGWSDEVYLRAARILKAEGVMVVAGCDNQYRFTIRQIMGSLAARWFLHSAIDVLWVSGDRAKSLAWKLGFRGDQCWEGVYCCDLKLFSTGTSLGEANSRFLYVGRYAERKGLDVLLAAYARYRELVDSPWELCCAGAGPLASMLEGVEGVTNVGFIQPEKLPVLMSTSSCFVLPSRYEAWGVVAQEAAAMGLPLICSDEVGAAAHLVRPHYSGYTFRNGCSHELADRMIAVNQLDLTERIKMGEAAKGLAMSYSPEIWAKTFQDGVLAWFSKTR